MGSNIPPLDSRMRIFEEFKETKSATMNIFRIKNISF